MLRTLLLRASGNSSLRRFAEHSAVGRRLSSRFVAGRELAAALAVLEKLRAAGLNATLDHLGENVTSAEEAGLATEAACRSLRALAAARLTPNISVKLTQLGLDIDPGLATSQARRIALLAGALGGFMRVDMESSRYTEATLRLVEELHREGLPVGTVLQSYLRRSEADLERLGEQGIAVRLVKGAYREPPELAYQHKVEVDANFARMLERLLARPAGPRSGAGRNAVATHDPRLIRAAVEFARARSVPPETFEFQMLYGIRRDLQTQLNAAGWQVRVYVPYGEAWYPYFVRRLAERPANLLFLLKNLV